MVVKKTNKRADLFISSFLSLACSSHAFGSWVEFVRYFRRESQWWISHPPGDSTYTLVPLDLASPWVFLGVFLATNSPHFLPEWAPSATAFLSWALTFWYDFFPFALLCLLTSELFFTKQSCYLFVCFRKSR